MFFSPRIRPSRSPQLLIAACFLLAAACGPNALATEAESMAKTLLDMTGVSGGLIVHVGCGEGELTAALGGRAGVVVQGLDRDPEHVAAARHRLRSLGRYGSTSVQLLTGTRLPYADNLVNLLVADGPQDLPVKELMRVVAPGGSVCLGSGDDWHKIVKPRPTDIDEWTHYLHDASGNAVAADQQVAPPKQLRWVSGPLWSRSHELNPSINALVSGGGRMFYILDEGIAGLADLRFPARWTLYARDAFSGVLLWKKPVPNWGYREWRTRGMWSAPLTLNRRVVTDGTRLFVTLGYNAPVTVLDAATGDELRTIPETRGTDELLLSDGVLLACVREQLSVASPPEKPPARRRNPQEWEIAAPGPARLVATDAESGELLWQVDPQPVTVLTLAADAGRICYHGAETLVGLDLQTGQRLWSTPCPSARGSRHSGGSLVMQDSVVLFTGKEGLSAYAAETGKQLWTGPRVSGPGITHPADLFVANGLVWSGDAAGTHTRERTSVHREGLDLRTGEVRQTIEIEHLISPLHHFRCYRSKATDRFLLLTKRGVEFVDLEGEQHMRNDWLRAMCHYGFMPCNGLLYVPPHHCFCYPGVKLEGFLALAGDQQAGDSQIDDPSPAGSADVPQRLVTGPAFGQAVASSGDSTGDWPTYRHDALRSGATGTPVADEPQPLWQTRLQGRVTPAVVVGERVYVAEIDAHRICCLDAERGEIVWDFTAGGRVDSPPTIYRGRALFGCRDGWVYCLRAEDGALVWRFRAAPREQQVVAYEQVESSWPVPGSVLILDDVAYFAAGRSSFLDGGVRLYGLNPEDGQVRYETCVEGPWPDVHSEVGRPFDMEGVKSDVLVSDGENLHLYQMSFDRQLRDITGERASELGDRLSGRRLIATSGLLDDSWYDRTYWMYSNRWPGFYYANDAPKAGQILVFDDQTTYGLHVFTERLRLSPAFTPGGAGYELFADDNDNEPVLTPQSINREKGPGFSRAAPPKWSCQIPVRALAMVLADDRLFLAGPPDEMPEEDPYASFEGRSGSSLWIVSAGDGRKMAEYPLDALPAFDGLIAAKGRLYLTTATGELVCFGAN